MDIQRFRDVMEQRPYTKHALKKNCFVRKSGTSNVEVDYDEDEKAVTVTSIQDEKTIIKTVAELGTLDSPLLRRIISWHEEWLNDQT